MPKISVCVPVYQYGGSETEEFFRRNLESIRSQTFTNFEVVICDQSEDDRLETILVEEFEDLPYVYERYDGKGMSVNINRCIDRASGTLIKPLFQDDFFYCQSVLNQFAEHYDVSRAEWFSFSYNHFNGREFTDQELPHYADHTLWGNNRLSSPSAIGFVNRQPRRFDENLNMLMDCDFYYTLNAQFGDPTKLNFDGPAHISMGIHSNQTQQTKDRRAIEQELEYLIEKHGFEREHVKTFDTCMTCYLT